MTASSRRSAVSISLPSDECNSSDRQLRLGFNRRSLTRMAAPLRSAETTGSSLSVPADWDLTSKVHVGDAAETSCPECGARFPCAIIRRVGDCWWSDVPAFMPLTPGKGSCYCPGCLLPAAMDFNWTERVV
jgi:hypothetical protein